MDGPGIIAACALGPEGLDALAAALSAEDLPRDTLDAPNKHFFAFRGPDGTTIGYGGLEQCGPDAVLRSVVMMPAARGHGHGRRLMEGLVAEALRLGVRRLHLLTLDAAGFFAKCGFASADRAAAPAAIAATAEFAALCPDTATCMQRDLSR